MKNWLDLLGWNEDTLKQIRSVGYSYLRQGKYDISLRFFEALSIFKPVELYDLQVLGAIYLQLGLNLDALKTFDEVLRTNPKDLSTQLNRAKALFALGYTKQGISQTKALMFSENEEIARLAQGLLLSYT